MKEKALKTLQRITAFFTRRFGIWETRSGMARVKADFFVNPWQGAIVAGEGLEYIGRVVRYLKEIVPPSC